jgi:hypothetical protein
VKDEGKEKKEDGLIPKHGGYRNLKTFQLAERMRLPQVLP